jgi:hypothetical protein
MRDKILASLSNPEDLEKLYRTNKNEFKRAFDKIYPDLGDSELANFWHQRLNYESDSIAWGSKKDISFLVIICLGAGLIAKLPGFFGWEEDYFYSRNIGFILFPALTAFFARKNQLPLQKIAILAVFFGISALYINLLPRAESSDTLILACMHLLLMLWVVLGVSFVGFRVNDSQKKLDFLRANGETIIMVAILSIASGLLTSITFGLFSLIGVNISGFFLDYIIMFGAPAIPIVAAYLTQTNPQLVNKVSPIIAKLFSPIVLVMLLVYLSAIIFTGKDPYNDREFLLIFNILLIGVLALISFSVAEQSSKNQYTSSTLILLLLAMVTVIVNGVALSAIVFRIAEWGITPNRMAVLGSNLLILTHVLILGNKLFQTVRKKTALSEVGNSIVGFIPFYLIWVLIVVFGFPLIFGFQ